MQGTVNPLEAGAATCDFDYGTSTSYGEKAECQGPGSEKEPIPGAAGEDIPQSVHSLTVTGLLPDTTYDYRTTATNHNGTNTGLGTEDEGSFITPGPGISEESATEVSSTSVKLHAAIDPDGAATSYYFQYGEQSVAGHYTTPVTPFGSGTSTVPVEQLVQEHLESGKLYHYRVVVVSGGQSFPGPDETFTTQGVGAFGLPTAGSGNSSPRRISTAPACCRSTNAV